MLLRGAGLQDTWSIMEVFTVDAFTDRPFSGNPAAVCIVREQHVGKMDDAKMQAIAAEMNLSETAFLTPDGDSNFEDGSSFKLRWFTPQCEVSLCGHATLATAAAVFHALGNPNEQLRFQTKSGLLSASRDGDIITLDFPLNPCIPEEPSPLQELIKLTVGGLPLADVQYSTPTGKLLLRLSDATSKSELEALNPDTSAMLGAHKGKIKGVIVTVKGSGDYDFFSRYFGPWVGIPEDPVTGAAHTVLASYWSSELGKSEMLARQCSKRGGDVRVTVGRQPGRVYLAGKAYIVMKGKLYL